MAIAMSLGQIIARLGFAPNLASPWLTSFAIGVAVAIPTAILVAPRAQRLASNIGIKVLALRGDYSKDAVAGTTSAGEDQA